MYIAGSESSSISVDEPAILTIALYIREAAGLAGCTVPEIPLLDPSSQIWPVWGARPSNGLLVLPDPFTGALDREQTALEWQRWWRHILADGSSAMADLKPPRFPAFANTPSLRSLLQTYHERANLWTDAISSDPLMKRAHAAPKDGLAELATLAGRRWRSGPFRLRLTVIPVRTEHAWQLAPDHILVTRHLIAHRDNLLDWLRSRILAVH